MERSHGLGLGDGQAQGARPGGLAGPGRLVGSRRGLFETIDNHDPSALIGLPLIALARLLREAGVTLP
jgi:septum formation protein